MRQHPQPQPGDLARAPFSNGTMGEIFTSNVCRGECIHDGTYGKPDEELGSGEPHCPLITLSMVGVTPREWLTDPTQPDEARGCTEFATEAAPDLGPVAVDLFGVFAHEPACQHEHYIEDESGNRLCVRCDHEWWVDPL